MVVMDSTQKLSEKDKDYIIKLAKRSIEYYAEKHEILEVDVPARLKKKRATFVTVYLNKKLRGCIGMLHAVNPLYKDVISNSVAAAFHDDRFPPLTQEELKHLKIEISILSRPEKIDFSSPEDILSKVTKQDGIILTKGHQNATFLPKVWESFSSKEAFFSHLCMKAGLEPDEWKRPSITVFKYSTEVFSG
ncbi:MAG: AmmeMemoRadiSam system protein A [Candidatus Aenigmatarchaeota archaeon]|nr:AmmeMemoRadiSam system protein A [Nanoarchaeota archaeon]